MSVVPRISLPPDLSLAWSLVSRPLRAKFGISRGAKNYAVSLRVELHGHGVMGRGESVPYARYGEHLPKVGEDMKAIQEELARGKSLDELLDEMVGGCVREALDAARWDFLCKKRGVRIRELLGVTSAPRIRTCYTVSLDTPEVMAKQAAGLQTFGTLKLKLGGGEQDIERIQAVAKARPDARLIADVNEAWTAPEWNRLATQSKAAGLSLLEQPLPAKEDQVLGQGPRPIECYADESVHGLASLEGLVGRYDGVNIKLGKCGGLDRGLDMVHRAKALGFKVMVGCMVGSSRSIAPALVLAALAQEVDLDAHLWLVHDVRPGLTMRGDEIETDFPAALWG